jgi:hypothetical protein
LQKHPVPIEAEDPRKMQMGVDQPGHDELPRSIKDTTSVWDGDLLVRANLQNPLSIN